MTILRIVYDWPDQNVTTEGLAPAPYELSLAQAKLGYNVIVLCGNLNGKNLKAQNFRYTLLNGKITVYNLPRALAGFGPFLTTSILVPFYYFWLKASSKIALVHNHGHLGVWFLVYKSVFGLFDKTPIIGHYHITARGRELALKAQSQKISDLTTYFEYPIHKLSDYLLAKLSKHIVVVSSNIAEELMNFYQVPAEKITLVESAIDIDRFTDIGSKVSLGFSEDSIIIGNGGRLSKRKNIDILIEALAFLPKNYKLILWGSWDEALESKMMKYIAEKNLEDRVKYVGSINYFDVDKYYRAVDLFVLPSSYEGLPKVVIEALGCGCKVLASGFSIDKNIPNLSLIDSAEITPEFLAENILKTMNLVEDYEETKKILAEHYSWKSKAELLRKLYNKYI